MKCIPTMTGWVTRFIPAIFSISYLLDCWGDCASHGGTLAQVRFSPAKDDPGDGTVKSLFQNLLKKT